MKHKLPKLYKGKEWFIEYSVQHPDTGEWHDFKKRKGLNNKSLTNKQRAENAKDAIASLTELLKQGLLNPWAEEINEAAPQVITVSDALKMAFEFKLLDFKPGSDSPKDYKSCMNVYIGALNELSTAGTDVKKFTRRMAIEGLDYLQSKRKFSNARWNIYKERISSLFTALKSREYIDSNPLHEVPLKKVIKSDKFDPTTDEEQLIIDTHLYQNHRRLFLFKSIVCATGVREKELLGVKGSNVDLKTGFITVPDTKPGGRKTIPLNDELIDLMSEQMKGCKPGDYVFSSKLEPGEKRWHRNRVTELWKKIVQDPPEEGGLGINRKLYHSQKKYGANKYLRAGVPLELLRQMFGHSSQLMTERYATELKNKAFEEIKKKSPGIIPK